MIVCLQAVESQIRKRQYEHIKESELEREAFEEDAERIAAAATTNKTGRKKTRQRAKLLFHIYIVDKSADLQHRL